MTPNSDTATDMSAPDDAPGSGPPVHDPVGELQAQESSSENDGGDFRSSSPALKRPATEMAIGSSEMQDVETEMAPFSSENAGDDAATEGNLSGTQRTDQQATHHHRAGSVDMIGREEHDEVDSKHESVKSLSDDTTSSASESVYPTPSSMSTYTSSTREEPKSQASPSHTVHDAPPIDEQVATVTRLMMQTLKERQKGYVVSASWLNRVLSRSTTKVSQRDKVDKTASEGEIGPVDNSDLVLVTDPSTVFKDELGEPFIPLRPGLQIGDDFEVLPEEAWDLIMKWYSLSKDSPSIIRYAHNINVAGNMETFQYELYPPIFTILKLWSPTSATTSQTLMEKARPPVKVMASRHTPYQQWLKKAKGSASIDVSTKVRVWRILEGLYGPGTSGIITPAASRSTSPAPGATLIVNAGNSLLLDATTFVNLNEGSQREQLEIKDQTANAKYNGSLTINHAGLGGDAVIVLEEQIGGPAGGEWVSDTFRQNPSRLSVAASSSRGGPQNRFKAKTVTTGGRASPTLGAITRGRQRKDGKLRGVTGLSNLGNSCYMNSALQCVRSVEELTQYFLQDEYKRDLNPNNPLSHNGDVAKAYANLLHQLYDEYGPTSFAPRQFKQTVGRYGPAFSGYGQQDSQEFVLFLLDGLQEDLNRIQKKPYIEKPDSTDEMVHDQVALKHFADKCWDIYKARNDSVITDLFAGMYKSTLVCPVCDKVSIIFDPFSNLTLQLPIENLWSKEIFFFPLHQRPIRVDVDIDKNASIKALKEYVGRKVNVDPRRLIMAEIYKHKFYKMFENTIPIGDCQIAGTDDIGIFEVESVPTNYDPDKPPKRSSFSGLIFHSTSPAEIPSFDSPKADRMLIPIFNRVFKPHASRYSQRQLFGAPSYTIVTREDAFDYDSIFRKILAEAATLTTRDILREDEEESAMSFNIDDSDTVDTSEDEVESSDPKIKASSVGSEDGFVDVSMRDADDVSAKDSMDSNCDTIPRVLRPGSFIPPMLRSLFDVKILRSNEIVPLGFSSLDESKDFPLMLSRVAPKPPKRVPRKKIVSQYVSQGQSPESSEDELNEAPRRINGAFSNIIGSGCYDDSISRRTKDESGSESSLDTSPTIDNPFRPAGIRGSKQTGRQLPSWEVPLIRPGEGIVLDWNEEAFDALFGADNQDESSLRGAPTWMNIDRLPDPELAARRHLRQTRRRMGISLSDCLDEFGKEEILSQNDAWYCPRCKEHRRATKKFELWKCPDILVMHLKRFSANRGFRDKIDVRVEYPIELDMDGRVEMPDEGKSSIYDLIAVDNHYGGLGGGHYTAYAKNFVDGSWYEYNDSHVSKKNDPASLVTNAGYLLFYRRRSDRPLGGEYLANVTETAHKQPADSDTQVDSRANSPSGEGQRLDGSSRNGSSSALAVVAAAHQAGDGGLQAGTQLRVDDDGLPEYSVPLPAGEQSLEHGHHLEGMDLDDEPWDPVFGPNPLSFAGHSMWSFDRADTYGTAQIIRAPPASHYGEDDLDDNASNTAVKGGDLSDSETPLNNIFNDGSEEHGDFAGGIYDDNTSLRNMIHPFPADDEDDEMPVMELHPDDDQPVNSD